MGYPSLEQYQTVLQHPGMAFTDPELKAGTIETTGLGLPVVQCGGFALTYSVETRGKRYAVRCFHKEARQLETRYAAISRRLQQLSSSYFLDFEFQPKGVRVDGAAFPVVKMIWAAGETLGDFLENHRNDKTALKRLREALCSLAEFLEQSNIAHGDIQTGNVMVSGKGGTIQLIDYDGMYVDEISQLGSSEVGHRNFQHPARMLEQPFDATLDRFSLIELTAALRALEEDSHLWTTTQSDVDGIVFRANDFADPASSSTFARLYKRLSISDQVRDFAALCQAPYSSTPCLNDFLAGRRIPAAPILASVSVAKPRAYLAPYPVLDATDYKRCLAHVGDRVEIIGRIVEVKEDRTRYGKSYVFINFGDWHDNIVKTTIWAEGLATMPHKPTSRWVGKWVSVLGLMEPPFYSKRYRYTHLSITITQGNQITIISEDEARFRLTGSAPTSIGGTRAKNTQILERVGGKGNSYRQAPSSSANHPIAKPIPSSTKHPSSPNENVLAAIKRTTSQTPRHISATSQPSSPQVPPKSPPSVSQRSQPSSRGPGLIDKLRNFIRSLG